MSNQHRAVVRDDWLGDRVLIGLADDRHVYDFSKCLMRASTPGTETEVGALLPLNRDAARALYEALAEFFGHTGHDTRALRRDYDAERGRVDRLINHLMNGAK